MPADHDRPRKRKRVTQACQRCRTKKFRCDGEAPSCGLCLSAEATCSYDTTSGRQRGLKPGYVRVLESLWGSVFQNIPGSELVASRLLAGLPAHAPNVVDEPGGDDASPLKTWRASTIPAAIRTVLDGGSLSAPDVNNVAATAWSLPPTCDAENVEQYDCNASPAPSPPACAPLPSVPSVSGDLYPLDLPQDWQLLVQVYLCTEYCCLPIFEKSCPYRWAYKYQDDARVSLHDLDHSRRGRYASLWAVLVLGEMHLRGTGSIRIAQMKQAAKTLLATVESMGPDPSYSYAFLLWALVYTGCREFTLAKMMLAQAVVLADIRSGSVSAPADKGEVLTHGACFVLETFLAFATGAQTSSLVVDADSFHFGDVGEWDPFTSVLEPGRESTASVGSTQLPPSRTGSTFKALIKLMVIMRKTRQPDVNLEALAAELKVWEASLAADLRESVLAQAIAPQTSVPSQLSLQSWYTALRCTITGLRQSATSADERQVVRSEAVHQASDALHTIELNHGLGMLPATSGVLLAWISRQALAQPLPETASYANSQLITAFSHQWGWPDVNLSASTQTGHAGPGSLATRFPQHQTVADASRTKLSTSNTAVLGHVEPEHTSFSQATGATLETSTETELGAMQSVAQIQPWSQQRPNDQLSAPAADSSIVADADSFLDTSTSHDLLEYLTLFENSNGYVERWRHSVPRIDTYPFTNFRYSDDRNYMEPLGFLVDLDYSA